MCQGPVRFGLALLLSTGFQKGIKISKFLEKAHSPGDPQTFSGPEQGPQILPGPVQVKMRRGFFKADPVAAMKTAVPEELCLRLREGLGFQVAAQLRNGKYTAIQRRLQPYLPPLPGGKPFLKGAVQGRRRKKYRAVKCLCI